jgi:uncharacterized protein YbcI
MEGAMSSVESSRDGSRPTPSLSEISRAVVTSMKTKFGRGPVSAKSYMIDDFLLVVMRGGLTPAEETLLGRGREDAVREFRQVFENEVGPDLIAMIERMTGRDVVTYQSQILFDPTILVEIFFFADEASPAALEATARAVTESGSRAP